MYMYVYIHIYIDMLTCASSIVAGSSARWSSWPPRRSFRSPSHSADTPRL